MNSQQFLHWNFMGHLVLIQENQKNIDFIVVSQAAAIEVGMYSEKPRDCEGEYAARFDDNPSSANPLIHIDMPKPLQAGFRDNACSSPERRESLLRKVVSIAVPVGE